MNSVVCRGKGATGTAQARSQLHVTHRLAADAAHAIAYLATALRTCSALPGSSRLWERESKPQISYNSARAGLLTSPKIAAPFPQVLFMPTDPKPAIR